MADRGPADGDVESGSPVCEAGAKGGCAAVPRALSIAASDSSGAAGVQGDLRVFAQCGVYGVCAVTLIAAQDTYAVRRIFRPAPSIVVAQIDTVAADTTPDACKIGWYYSPELTTVIAGRIRRRDLQRVVLDPCLWSERGEVLTRPRTVKRMVSELLPLVQVLTVTPRELVIFGGGPAETVEEMAAAAERVRALGPAAVVVEEVPTPDGSRVLVSDAGDTRVLSAGTGEGPLAGTGSLFSAALTAALARGEGIDAAAGFAAEFVARARERHSAGGVP